MSFSYLTSAAGYSGGNYASPGTATLTYTATNGAPVGSLVTVSAFWYDNDLSLSATITDNASGSPNTYGVVQSVRNAGPGNVNLLFFRSYNVQGTPTAWTLNLSGGNGPSFASSVGIQAEIFTGAKTSADPLDGSNINVQTSVASGTDNIVSGTFTPSAAGDLIVCVVRQSTGYDATVGTGFTLGVAGGPSPSGIATEYNLSGSSGSQQGTWNAVTTATTVCAAMAFLPSQVCGSLPLLGVGCSVGWRAALAAGAGWRTAKAIERNENMTRRRLLRL